MPQNYLADVPEVRGKGTRIIFGSFAPNGSSDPSSASFRGGSIKSVTRAAAGRWTVTLREKGIRAIEAMIPGAQLAANNVDSTIQFGSVTLGTGSTDTSFTMRNAPGGTEADISADTNNRISFVLIVRRSVNK